MKTGKALDGGKALLLMAGFLFLWELEHLINFLGSDEVQWWVDILAVCAAGGMLLRADWKNRTWCRLLLAGLAWIFLTSLIRGQVVVERTHYAFLRGMLCFLVLAFAGCTGTEKQRRGMLKTLIALWTVFYTGLSILGIWSAFSHVRILDLSQTLEICLRDDDHRLKLMAYATVTAANLTMSIAMALAGHAMCTKRAGRILYLCALPPMLFCLALTGGRTGYVCTGAAMGYALWMHLRPALEKKAGRVLPLALGVGILVLTMAAVSLGLPLLTRGFNAVRSGQVMASADAEAAVQEAGMEYAEADISAETVMAEERGVFSPDGLSGRPTVWKAALQLLKTKPYLLLTGTSIPQVMEHVLPITSQETPEVFDHVHCMYLQILLETGLPGLGLALAVLVLFLKKTVRLIRTGDREAMWALPALALMLFETVDCVTRLDKGFACMPVLMLFLGMVMGCAADGRREGKD